MSSRYEGLSAKEADDLMIGIINLLVSDAMDEARSMTQEEWDERDAAHLPHYFASAIFYAVKNRLREAP
ncbi:hypothetical protein GFB56_00320 [Ensifer sp. T173]|uniref:Uncharacterized protein n=1 Tax=Ensifer canadensis TaxID=555315 RepID=A0AAW4FAV8_9HYPH|nr:hypothetical protein [Ensifer canadensis]MBM3089264.1 hypothetical protein [Ensifer canadensis]UBI76812.1 hypothetical protein J3R84_06705 [Ensifer canadensis]